MIFCLIAYFFLWIAAVQNRLLATGMQTDGDTKAMWHDLMDGSALYSNH